MTGLQTYRIVVERPDHSRIVFDEGLHWHLADNIKRLLLDTNAFPSVDVEPEGLTFVMAPDDRR